MSTLGLTFLVDTQLIGDPSSVMSELRSLHAAGMIQLIRADVLDTELSQIQDEAKRGRLMAESATFPEEVGVWVLGHSRVGHTRAGGPGDQAAWEQVWNVLSPGRDVTTAKRQHVRDAMHVWTAMRSGATGFITKDGSGKRTGVLDRAESVRAAFGFELLTPAQALALTRR